MSGKSLIHKILESHLVEGKAITGSEAKIKIDQALLQDATGTMAFLELEAMGIDRVKTEIAVQYVDHNMSQFGPNNQNDHLYLQSVCAAKGAYFSRPGNGICHQVHLERFGTPGKTLIGSDSHTPTNGGIGMIAIGAGGLDVASAMAGMPFKLTFPRVIGVKLTGELSPWVAAKDVILKLLSVLSTKGNVGCAVEYFGPGVDSLSVPERATITNMGAELGVTTSVFPSDEKTRAFLKAQAREQDWQSLAADEDAEYDRVIEIDLSELEPMAACPSSPDNIKTIAELSGTEVRQVIIGSCTNSSLKDLMLVAKALKGRRVNEKVSLAIAPGSRQVLKMLADNGALADMIAAGARLLESGCGPCIGQGCSPASDAVTLRTFNRNFAGRTGTKNDLAYLVSPETAVAAALTGEISDPRKLQFDCPAWQEVSSFLIDDEMIIAPPTSGANVKIIRKDTIGDPPNCMPFPEKVEGTVVIKVEDKITTDHIMPAGTFLKLRSNIPQYSQVVFNCFTEDGKPSFAERAADVRDAGKHGVIVAGESYGQGSSREHAAICPMFLGIRCVIAQSIERIHAANLINFGILPLILKNRADYDAFDQDDEIIIEDSLNQLAVEKPVTVKVKKSSGEEKDIVCTHTLSALDIDMIKAGGRLNMVN